MPRLAHRSRLLVLALAAALAAPAAAVADTRGKQPGGIHALRREAGGPLHALFGRGTGAFRFVAPARGGVLVADDASTPPVARALRFLRRHGDVFGLSGSERGRLGTHSTPLRVGGVMRNAAKGWHVRLDQVHRGVKVFGGRLAVHMNADGITAANGLFVPRVAVETRPTLSASAAVAIAGRDLPGVIGTRAERFVYHTGLAADVAGRTALAYAVTQKSATKGERVWVDAHSGEVLAREEMWHSALERRVYAGAAVNGAEARREGQAPSPVPAVNDIYDFTGHTYDLFLRAFGRDSYDARGKAMRGVTGPTPAACPNATWDGLNEVTTYCPGLELDDVVAHEWGHAYTDYTHDLVYECEPGGLNESYSDIWGETVDLVNGVDGAAGSRNDVPAPTGVRWLIAEDSRAVGLRGPIRDMWRPTRRGDPDRVSTMAACPEVHSGSGPPNHAYAMLVDGKTFNGKTVSGIGLTKAAHIYYLAMAGYQHPNTRFAEHALVLRSACDSLVGASLPGLTAGMPAETLTPSDCEQVTNATDAAELRHRAQGVVLGQVTDAAGGTPLAGMCVDAYDDERVIAAFAPTGADGRYHLTELAPGSYRIRFYDCSGWRYAPQWHAGKATFEAADPVVVGAKEMRTGVDAALEPLGSPDVAVKGVTVENDPLDPVRHTVVVKIDNLAPTYVRAAQLRLEICPATTGACSELAETFDLEAAASVEQRIEWWAIGWLGDARLTARVQARGDLDSSNDEASVRYSVATDADGVGIGGVSVFPG